MIPAIAHHDVTVYQGDAADVLRSLPTPGYQPLPPRPDRAIRHLALLPKWRTT